MLTFACNDMRRLRVLALVANAAFIAYGSLAALLPVLVLHLVPAPINLWRLFGLKGAAAPRVGHGAGSTLNNGRWGDCSRRHAAKPEWRTIWQTAWRGWAAASVRSR